MSLVIIFIYQLIKWLKILCSKLIKAVQAALISPLFTAAGATASAQDVTEPSPTTQAPAPEIISSIEVQNVMDSIRSAATADLVHESDEKQKVEELKKAEAPKIEVKAEPKIEVKPETKVEAKKPEPTLPTPKRASDEKMAALLSGEDLNLHMFTQVCNKFIGVRESGGANKGKEVEMFQKAVDGKANGEPWCCAFTWYCIMQAEKELKEKENIDAKSWLYKTEHVLTMWNQSPKAARTLVPKAGYVIVYQHYTAEGKATAHGHVGIIVDVIDAEFLSAIEGNTSGPKVPGNSAVVREGDGVYLVKRSYKHNTGTMRVVGFLKPWKG